MTGQDQKVTSNKTKKKKEKNKKNLGCGSQRFQLALGGGNMTGQDQSAHLRNRKLGKAWSALPKKR